MQINGTPETIFEIKRNEDGVNECLQEMLSEWLGCPVPTWIDLADAVESVDSSLALKIRARIADV